MGASIGNRQKILVEDPIGSEYVIPPGPLTPLGDLLWKGAVDAYCRSCKTKSVFGLEGPSFNADKELEALPKLGVVVATARCQRESVDLPGYLCAEQLFACFSRNDRTLVKIGQQPSRADLDFGLLDAAYGELSASFRKELGRAVGLRAHGIGIGAFVYLRRIFESLVEEAHVLAKGEPNWDEQAYERSRVHERIRLLGAHLPSRLVASAGVYGILSKGIHELDEKECLERFDAVQQAIHFILAQRHEEKEHDRVLKQLGKVAQHV